MKTFDCKFLLPLIVLSPLALAKAQPPDTTALPVTTSYLGNTLQRGPAWTDAEPSAQRWVMDYFSGLTASPDGYVFGTTTWEEGIQRTGVYKDGDNILDRPYDVSGTAIAASQKYLAIGREGGQKVVVIKRVPGQAVWGKGGTTPGSYYDVAVNDKPDYIQGVAIDEKNDRLYVAFPAQNLIKVFKLSDGTAQTSFTMIPDGEDRSGPAASGRMVVDGDGNLWVTQSAVVSDLVPLKGTPSGSAPFEGHDLAGTFDNDDNKYFVTKEKDGFIALDLGTPHRIYTVHIKGGGDWAGAKLQGATTANGPWTDLYTVKFAPGGWPEQWITVNDDTPFRYLRFLSGPDSTFSINGFDPYTKSAPRKGRVLKFSPDGKRLAPEIAIDDPSALAWDAKNNRLLIADNSANQQVCAYTNMDAPQLDATFGKGGKLGEKGGVFAGGIADQGRIGPGRFDEIRGVGVDSGGTVYVGMVGSYGVDQTRLEAYAPNGTFKWRMEGLSFENHCAVNPLDETDVYSGANRFKLDYTKKAGNEWTHVATTVNPHRFPDDRRAHGDSVTDVMRVIGGKPFLIAGRTAVYKWDAAKEGNIAIPVAFFYGLNTGTPWPSNQPLGVGRFIWNDLNGDGQFQADEYDKTNSYMTGPASFDDDGNYWMIPVTETPLVIRKVAVSALDAHGNPQWHYDSPRNQNFPFPAPFDKGDGNTIGSVSYDVASKALFVSGFTPDFKRTIDQKGGFGRVLARYEVQGGKLVKTHQLVLPYDVDLGGGPNDAPDAVSLAGDYVFIGYWNIQTVRIYRKSDLGFVGQYQVGRQSTAPIIDGTALIKAVKRTGANEYLIFHSNYVANSMIMIRWKPDVKLAPPTPAKFKVARLPASCALSWQVSNNAAGYAVERMDHSANGWGEWHEIGRVKDGSLDEWSDPTIQAGKKYAYRLRAYNMGVGHGGSDYTASIFVEASAS